ncbi:MAG: hypothetical protein WBB19_00240 [Desulforhopalus sp.]
MTSDPAEAVENEWYIVRYSGETPEIAYNSAIYYLTRAQDGPHLKLGEDQVELLKNAAYDRYAEIVLRDLQHANCNKSIYRGIGRSIINYRRFHMFCERQQLEVGRVRRQAAEALLAFLETEMKLIQNKTRLSIINCSYEELQLYAVELGVAFATRFKALEKHCLAPS